MPEMGEGVIEGTVSRWLKEPGDPVEKYEPILEIETDKVTTEATAEVAGTMLKIVVEEGETVPVGAVLAYVGEPGEGIEEEGEAADTAAAEPAPAPEAAPTAESRPQDDEAAPPEPAREGAYTGRISPVVGRIAAEHEVDLNNVPGTGRNGRITKKDILAYVEQRETAPEAEPEPEAKPTPEPEPAKAAPTAKAARAPQAAPEDELMPLSNMRRAIAEHMVRSKKTSPHVTTVFEFDFSAVVAHRAAHKAQFAKDGVKLTFTPYIVAAAVAALKEHPMANSAWSEEGIILKKAIHIGMAAAIDEGLIVPVIKDADSLNLLGLARAVNDLAERARNNQLRPDEVQGGTFSITNHGVSGSLFATPIINQPQCGILGVGKIEKRVKVIDDAIAIRPLAFVSFTFDHRILDGASADYFVATIKEEIENWS
jgi:2-oxoglutarate dehydrogenase E2 component (dihydrolipoamide succinyltransferase)